MLEALAPRLREKIEPQEDSGCWVWVAGKSPLGYGRFGVGSNTYLAHRIVYEALVGPVPDGLELDHLCRNPSCVNPGHLEPVTHAENMRRGANANKTHCPNGHEYTPENTHIRSSGWRQCRACHREQELARIWKNKAGDGNPRGPYKRRSKT